MTLEEVGEGRVCESGNRVYPNQSIKSQKGTLDRSQGRGWKNPKFSGHNWLLCSLYSELRG